MTNLRVSEIWPQPQNRKGWNICWKRCKFFVCACFCREMMTRTHKFQQVLSWYSEYCYWKEQNLQKLWPIPDGQIPAGDYLISINIIMGFTSLAPSHFLSFHLPTGQCQETGTSCFIWMTWSTCEKKREIFMSEWILLKRLNPIQGVVCMAILKL